jgi:L-lysine 6-transaminase
MKNALNKEQVSRIEPKDVHGILGQVMLTDGYDIVCDLTKSHGAYLYDSKSETYFLDFFSFFASLPTGFNHPKLMTPEFLDKLGKIAVNKPSLSDIYTLEMAQFVETFRRVALPEGFDHIFFVEGGALAVENALKVAMDWKVRKNIAKGIGEDKGTQIIHFVRAFHGRSGYTMSLTNSPDPRKTMFFPKFNWPRVSTPKATFPLIGENLAKTEELEKKTVSEIMNAISANPDDIVQLYWNLFRVRVETIISDRNL